jgi:hypothetical protein
MTHKQAQEVKDVLMKFRNDENNNNRPEVIRALALIEIELLRRLRAQRRQRNDLIDSKMDRGW